LFTGIIKMNKLKVLVADDHEVVREGLRKLVNSQSDMEVVGEARNGQEALDQVRSLRPDVVLLDVVMPGMSGLSAISLIRDVSSSTQVVVFSMHMKEAYVEQALASGAIGYITKTSPASEVSAAIRAAHRREYFLSSRIESVFIKAHLQKTTNGSEVVGYNILTKREQQVFRLMVEGNTTNHIADILCLSPKTVEKNRANIMNKLNVNSIVELVMYAVKIGIVDPDLWEV